MQQIYFRAGEIVPAGRPVVAILPPGNMKVRFFVTEAMLPRIAIDDTVNIQCDGCPGGLTAQVSFIARTAEFTPPVIYSLEERNKLVFMIEARPEKPERVARRPAGHRDAGSQGELQGAAEMTRGRPTSPSTCTG